MVPSKIRCLLRNVDMKLKIAFQLGLVVAITAAIILGCATQVTSQSISNTADPPPAKTPIVERQAAQGKTLSPSPRSTFPPEDPSPAATFPPAESTVLVDPVWEMLSKVNLDRALTDLKLLTGEEPICIDNECYTIENRKTGSEGLRWAKKYAYQELAGLGYDVVLQDWSTSEYSDQNIIARKAGTVLPEHEIYFVAHLDGVDTALLERYPAADDNAGGVADILEVARILKDYPFSRTIVLLISTGEEQGTLGVQSYLGQLSPSQLSAIQYVVNIDMIGYDANQDHVMELWHGDHPPSIDFVHTISETIQAYELDLVPRFVVGCG